jgi:hypothetical protein
VRWARALDGSEYMPGLVGLNNMKQNDYANVVAQALIRVHPIRCVARVCCVLWRLLLCTVALLHVMFCRGAA